MVGVANRSVRPAYSIGLFRPAAGQKALVKRPSSRDEIDVSASFAEHVEVNE